MGGGARRQLGEVLVAMGAITREQLAEGLRMQVAYGRRLGTNLVQLGAVELDILSRALSEQLQIPAARDKHFQFLSPSTLALLPAHIAERRRAIPLGVAGSESNKPLVVAFSDPEDVAALDEVQFVVGSRILPCVAPELRIAYYLEKLYGIRRPHELMRTSAPVGYWGPEASYQRLPGSEGLEVDLELATDDNRRRYQEPYPPLPESSWQQPRSLAPPRYAQGRRSPLDQTMPMQRLEGIGRDVADTPFLAPQAAPPQSRPPVAGQRMSALPPQPAAAPAPATAPQPLSLDHALVRLTTAATRDEVGELLVRHFVGRFGGGLVMIVRDGMVLGWKGWLPDLLQTHVESIALPLAMPSLFARACDSKELFVGVPPEDGELLQSRFFKLLGQGEPREVVAMPIVLRDRVVLLGYGQRSVVANSAPPLGSGLDALRNVAAQSLVRLIHQAKQGRH